ncbi:MAG: hypothetical protein ABIP06_10435 [Pyrinomonadaceae bacterium]
MREAVLSSTNVQENPAEKIVQKNNINRWKLVLITSIIIALLFAGAGLIISGLAYLDLVEHAKVLSRLGTIMIVVSAPLFVLAAHSLDEMRFEEKSLKRSRYSGNFGGNDSK